MLNVQIVKDMGTTKTKVTSNHDASKVQVTIWQTSFTTRKDLVTSDVSYVVETILQITRDILSTKSYKKKHTHQLERNNTLLLHKSNIPYKLNHELLMLK
jgi:hypothetical protein